MASTSRLLNVGKDICRTDNEGRPNGEPSNGRVVALFPVHVADATKHNGDQGDGFAEGPRNECGDGIKQALAGHIGCALE